jgi:hypothetical protein
VVAYHYDVASASTIVRTDSYTVSYLKKDGYLEQATSGSSTNTNYRPATDSSDYDSLGQRIAIVQHVTLADGTLADTVRAFAYDAAGQIVQRRDGVDASGTFQAKGGVGTTHYNYVNGQQVGAFDEGGGIHVLDGLTAFSNTNVGTSGYVVQTGDTLKSIAQAEYGNTSLWYVIAQANALSSDNDLVAGQTLTIPQVTTHNNSATTFQPYNASRISGSTTPMLPFIAPPPPSSGGCNALGEIIVIAVMVVVAYYVGPQVAAEVGHGLLGTVVGGAAAGASASAAGQLTGDALGVSHGFDWNQVLVGAASGAIAGGVAGKLSGVDGFSSTTAGNSLNGWGDAAVGASAYVGDYEAAKVTGQATHFSWAGLVAASASAAAAGAFGATKSDVTRGQLGADPWGNIEARAVGDVVSREVSVGLGDNHVQSWQQIGEDVFGNALGNAAVAGINAYEANHAQQTATPTYDPNKDPLLKYAQGYQGEMAFEQQAQGAVDGSPMLLADTAAPGNPANISDSRSMSTDSRWPSSGSDLASPVSGDQPITWPGSGYAGVLETDAYGNPYRINGLDVTDMVPMTVTATAPSDNAVDGDYFAIPSLSNIDEQLMDVVPGSDRWRQLTQQKAAQGLFSSDPVMVSQGRLAALQLEVGQNMQDIQRNGALTPVVEDSTPSLLAYKAQQAQLNGVGLFLLGTSAPALLGGGKAEAPVYEPASPMGGYELVPLSDIPNMEAADASASSGNALAPNVYHVTTNPYAAPSILDKGIDPAFLNPNARFGSAFYAAEQPGTALAELANYNAEPFMAINFSTNSGAANVLDLTNPDIASAWGYEGGPITPATQSIGSQASAQGYNVIQYYSLRAPGTINYAVLNNYNDILTPVAISPAKP